MCIMESLTCLEAYRNFGTFYTVPESPLYHVVVIVSPVNPQLAFLSDCGAWFLCCFNSLLPPLPTLSTWPVVPAFPFCPAPSRPLCLLQELHLLVRHTRQQAQARQQAQEHEAERLRIEIVKLREALDEEIAAKASLEGQLRVQREETGKGSRSSCHRASWIRYGYQEDVQWRFSLDLSLSYSYRCAGG